MFTASHSAIVQCYVVTSHKHDGRGEGGLQAAAEEPGGVRGEDSNDDDDDDNYND